jgi:MYXO-CTERM domain-containing protein
MSLPTPLPGARAIRLTAALGALALFAGPVEGAVTVEGVAQAASRATATLRVPATGTFDMPPVADGYLTVSVGMAGKDHAVTTVAWSSSFSGTSAVQGLTRQSSRVSTPTHDPGCRAELWGLTRPARGPGFLTVTIAPNAGIQGTTSVTAAAIVYANVRATSVGGLCCAEVSNGGSGVTAVNKTIHDTSRGDMVVDSVCAAWIGAAPGAPYPDNALNPVLTARAVQSPPGSNLYGFAGTAVGADVELPATSYRHMRWLQSGSRDWIITGLILRPTDAALTADAGAPPAPDASPRTDLSGPPDLGAPIDVGSVPPPPDAAALLADTATREGPPVTETADAGAVAPTPLDARGSLPLIDDPDGAAGSGVHHVDLQIGCGCRVGGSPAPGGLCLVVAGLAAAALRRRSLLRAARTHAASAGSPLEKRPRV